MQGYKRQEMSNEEAMGRLEGMMDAIADKIDSGCYTKDDELDFEMCSKLMKAIKKQIPQKPNTEIGDAEEAADRCPVCKGFVVGEYCHHCGQLVNNVTNQ